ncbi:MBL fold metallo-hydrolase [Allohahella marinimesophila]|uniref:MBL fold metallo-hydrolase n=2 Tax=Allohahella marinimesophila TaxID=1054972 RepID=A0ABP7PLT5_9GAMM
MKPDDLPPHHTAKGFRNLHIEDPDKTFFSFLRMRLFGETKWADHEETADQVPVQPLPPERLEAGHDDTRISWLGHSTFLIQRGGINILTDPVFSDRASPLSFAGPARYIAHVIDYSELPKIDYVVISHNHYDHLDERAVSQLAERTSDSTVFLVPLGLGSWMTDAVVDADKVREMDWWEQTDFGKLSIQAQPSQHWSARSLFDKMESLWASWLIDFDGHTIWFAGDTGYNDKQFKEIAERSPPIRLALIPIGAYSPRWFMKYYHVNPEEAVLMHQDLKAQQSIGMHWGTFPLTAEPPMEPLQRLKDARAAAGIDAETFGTMAVGESRIVR